MKNYIIKIKTYLEGRDKVTMLKILSNVVAFSGDLYSIDYHGVEHGIITGCEGDEFYIKIIINNLDWDYDILETVDEIINNFSRYGAFDVYSEVQEVSEPTEIPKYYIEHYYISSYHDFY
jgi:hypothetical protein